MEQQNDLGRLEKIIEQLLASFTELKKEKTQLEKKLESQEGEIVALREQLKILERDKEQVCHRVSTLITTIEKWEKENVEETGHVDVDDVAGDASTENQAANLMIPMSGQ